MRFVKLLAAALLLTSAALQMKITPGSWLTENATVIPNPDDIRTAAAQRGSDAG